MTAVTDHDHMDHTDHMTRTERGSDRGDTGSMDGGARHDAGGARRDAPDARPGATGVRGAVDGTGAAGTAGPAAGVGRARRDGDSTRSEGGGANGGARPGGDVDDGRTGGGTGGDAGDAPHARVTDTGDAPRTRGTETDDAPRTRGTETDDAPRTRGTGTADAPRTRGTDAGPDPDGPARGKGESDGGQDRPARAEDDPGSRDRAARGKDEGDAHGRPVRADQERDGRNRPAPGKDETDRRGRPAARAEDVEDAEDDTGAKGAEDAKDDTGAKDAQHAKGAKGGEAVSVPRPHGPASQTAAAHTPAPQAPTSPKPRAAADGTPPPKAAADAGSDADSQEAWDDGLIARRVTEANAAALAAERASATEPAHRGPGSHTPAPLAYDGPLRSRLDALRELVGLSRTRLDGRTLAEAGRVLDEAAARRRLSGRHTVVALAGATGSGKSQLFNALAGVAISETGVRRPTTAAPIACSWSDGAASLIDRLGIPGRLRRRPLHSADTEGQLRGLVLVDLPDHDSAALQHREQVDRILKLVDAVIWVVDPEKYADAILHERYLRPMAGHAEVMFIVLNQVDRLPGDAADQVLDDLRRLLDDDGIALGEHGEPGATVLALSALTGDGVGDLREALGEFVAERGAAARRVAADVDAAAAELRPMYATGRRVGLSEEAREEFAARLADAVGATAAGEAAERAWLRNANRACGTPWLRLWRWYQGRGESTTGRLPVRAQADEEATARQRVEQAVRTVCDRASAGLPTPWAQAVREAAVRGSHGLSEALDELAARAGLPPGRPPRPGWWPVAVLVQAAMTLLQVVGGAWLAGQIAGVMAPNLGVPVLLMVCGIVGGPLVEWACRMAARGPARRYGQEAERRLREAAASCGRARVLDPVASELLRYREVREQYGRVARSGAGAGVG
ncbi:GTPase [Streptomyces sp. NPDC013455]|uniref:GTPase n=1 Tax=Streptomyces sp. NPDC013455 TaxID=3155605 RepID=UPI0033EB5793